MAQWLTGCLIGRLAGRQALRRQRHSEHETTQTTAARHLKAQMQDMVFPQWTLHLPPGPNESTASNMCHKKQTHVEYVCISGRGMLLSQCNDKREKRGW